MGFWSFLAPARSVPLAGSATGGLLSWYSPQDSIETLFIADALPVAPDAVTRDTALRVPAVKRAHDIICTVIADMPWFAYDGDTRLTDQPEWLVNTATGIPPRDLRWAVTSDLFLSGWAAIGFKLGPDNLPVDALHIPRALWTLENDGTITVNAAVNRDYLQRVVPIRLGYGSNGLLFDGVQDIKDARAIRDAYRDRINNPIALTVLTLAAEKWDSWDDTERVAFRKAFMDGRTAEGGSTVLKPDWVTIDTPGTIATDLFESGRNANRLDIANQSGLPASMLEAVRQGGGGGGTEMRYTGVQNGGQRSEVWDFGVSKYASAIQARLSLDDVCAPGQSIRVDSTGFLSVPQPTEQQTSED
ncbi:hypothetical protein [Microbacterium sp. NPDC057650]|uniref:hypothetical protein n=1 Tax=unclassified Microbacterium TaxID=2609290 RepID=UPI0036704B94